jgi:ankyrin repeat domain-containing protein 50
MDKDSRSRPTILSLACLQPISIKEADIDSILPFRLLRYRDSIPPVPALIGSLWRLIQRFQDVYVVVGVLGESLRLRKARACVGRVRGLAEWPWRGLHILVTSRDEIDVREYLNPLPVEEVTTKNAGINQDIEGFTARSLQQSWALQKWSTYHSRIKEELMAAAKGV